jgi:phytoene dehydrogenase-like protein
MSKRFYDVIVLGADLGPLLAAALLAKRGFRVLVLGCDTQEDTYEEAGLRLPRWPSYFGVGGTPIVRRVFADLGTWQILRRKLAPLEPRYQVVLPHVRLDVTADRERCREELAREFGDAARAAEAFYARLGTLGAGLDRFLGEDLVLPPDGFWERRRFLRASLQNPFGAQGDAADVWGDIPEDHPFRLCVAAQVRWATHADPDAITPLQVARLHASWLDGGALPEGGPSGLRAFLRERIALHGGEIALGEDVAEIALRRGRAVGVRLVRDEEVTGAQYVVAGVETERLVRLFGEDGAPAVLAEAAAACAPAYRRFTCNLVVRRVVVPVGMARHVIVLPDPTFPPIEDNLLLVEVVPLDEERAAICTLVCARADRVATEPEYPGKLAARIERRLERLFPFLDRHLLRRSSPWILPADAGGEGAARVAPAERTARSPERMPTVPRIPHSSTLGLTCLSHRLAGRNLLLTGRDVIPGLGDEGLFLSAWTVAGIITQKDPRRVRLKRELSSALEAP